MITDEFKQEMLRRALEEGGSPEAVTIAFLALERAHCNLLRRVEKLEQRAALKGDDHGRE